MQAAGTTFVDSSAVVFPDQGILDRSVVSEPMDDRVGDGSGAWLGNDFFGFAQGQGLAASFSGNVRPESPAEPPELFVGSVVAETLDKALDYEIRPDNPGEIVE